MTTNETSSKLWGFICSLRNLDLCVFIDRRPVSAVYSRIKGPCQEGPGWPSPAGIWTQEAPSRCSWPRRRACLSGEEFIERDRLLTALQSVYSRNTLCSHSPSSLLRVMMRQIYSARPNNKKKSTLIPLYVSQSKCHSRAKCGGSAAWLDVITHRPAWVDPSCCGSGHQSGTKSLFIVVKEQNKSITNAEHWIQNHTVL